MDVPDPALPEATGFRPHDAERLSAMPNRLSLATEDILRDRAQELYRGIIGLQPRSVICLDRAFHGSDQLLTNAELEMKSHGIEFQTV